MRLDEEVTISMLQANKWSDGSKSLLLLRVGLFAMTSNIVTNKLLENKRAKLQIMPSAEHSRGKGTLCCMAMSMVWEKSNYSVSQYFVKIV